jgi:hypothetical protein
MICRCRFLFITLLLAPFLAGCMAQVTTGDGTVYYQDDFSDSASGWDNASGSDGAAEYSDGQYRMYSALANYLLWANPQKLFPADVIVDVLATKKAGPDDNTFGIVCRYLDTRNYYALVISSDGQAGIAKVRNGQGPTMISGAHMQPNAVIQKGNASNLLRAECIGNTLTLFVNDVLVASATDEDGPILSQSDVGLLLGSYDDPGTEVYFDGFLVRRP